MLLIYFLISAEWCFVLMYPLTHFFHYISVVIFNVATDDTDIFSTRQFNSSDLIVDRDFFITSLRLLFIIIRLQCGSALLLVAYSQLHMLLI